jgi:hypothetical protein
MPSISSTFAIWQATLVEPLEAVRASFAEDFQGKKPRPDAPIDELLAAVRDIRCPLLLKVRADAMIGRLRRQAQRAEVSPRSRESVDAAICAIKRLLRGFLVDLSTAITAEDLAGGGSDGDVCRTLEGPVVEKLRALELVIGHPIGIYNHTSFADRFGDYGLNESLFTRRRMQPVQSEAAIRALPIDRHSPVLAVRTNCFQGKGPLYGPWGALLDGKWVPQGHRSPDDWFDPGVVVVPQDVSWVMALCEGDWGVYAERETGVLV